MFCFEIPCSIQRWFDEIFLKSVLQKFNWKTLRICQMAQIANIKKLGRRRHLACTQIHNFFSCKIDILERKTNFPINMISFWFILGSRWALYQSGFSSSLIFLIHILSWAGIAKVLKERTNLQVVNLVTYPNWLFKQLVQNPFC